VTGIHNYRSGGPLAIDTGGFRTDAIFNGTFRPDVVPGVPQILDSKAPVVVGTGGGLYLNPAAFAQIPRSPNGVPLRLGTAPRILPNVRGPARVGEDIGIRKRFNFTETANFEVRGDFFNAFNRAGRGNPVTNITNPLFGKITGPAYGPRNLQVEARINF
jgi:hypothetical protein